MKKESTKEPSSSKGVSKKRVKDGNEDASKKKKQKKKKDPNAPKKAMSGFMFFSQMEREVGLILSLRRQMEKYNFIGLSWICC